LMNIPFIKNIIEENRMLKQKVSDLTDVIVMKEMNMLVKKNNCFDNNYVVKLNSKNQIPILM
jgi:hypothetical protein